MKRMRALIVVAALVVAVLPLCGCLGYDGYGYNNFYGNGNPAYQDGTPEYYMRKQTDIMERAEERADYRRQTGVELPSWW